MLRNIDHNIWVAEQPLTYLGLSVGTRMTVIKLSDGSVVAISPIQMTDLMVQQIDQIGELQHIVAPNLYHYQFTSGLKLKYPKATFWAAPGLQQKKPELPIDRTLEPGHQFLEDLNFVPFAGFQTLGWGDATKLNELVFFHPASRTLILTDAAFNFDQTFPILTQFAARILGSYDRLSPSWLEKLATRDIASVKQAVQQVLEWDFLRVIVGHGSIVEVDAQQQFRRGYEWVLSRTAQA